MTLPTSADVADLDSFPKMPSDAESAFLAYLADPSRSLRKLARALDRPEGTVLGWSTKHRWPERAAAWDQANQAEAFRELRAQIIRESLKSVGVAIAIRDNPKAMDRDRLVAAQWIGDLGGVGPNSVRRSGPLVSWNTPDADAAIVSGAELLALARSGDPSSLARLMALASGSPDPGAGAPSTQVDPAVRAPDPAVTPPHPPQAGPAGAGRTLDRGDGHETRHRTRRVSAKPVQMRESRRVSARRVQTQKRRTMHNEPTPR